MTEADAIRKEDRKRDEPGEPEDHCHCLHAEYREPMMRHRLRESPWHDDEVDECEDRPYRAEEEVVDLRG